VRGFVKGNWPPLAQTGMSHVIDVEDHSIVNMVLANGVLATYQQCHFTPDACRNYTVIGTKGRLENYGDYGEECTINVWTSRSDGFRQPDVVYHMPKPDGDHGGADTRIAREFTHFVRYGGKTYASAIAARNSVAAGCQATASLRSGGMPLEVPDAAPGVVTYFDSL
jgi:predicted dehydrogenase